MSHIIIQPLWSDITYTIFIFVLMFTLTLNGKNDMIQAQNNVV